LQTAVAGFRNYCKEVQHARLASEEAPGRSSKALRLLLEGESASPQAYRLLVEPYRVSLTSGTELGLFRGLIELERRMAERGGPFLSPTLETNQPAFSPRYVSSYFSLMTDVLGQELIDPFPEGYLNELVHQDADGVWVYALLQDLVPSPVF